VGCAGRCLENISIIFMRKEEFLTVIKEFRNDYVSLFFSTAQGF